MMRLMLFRRRRRRRLVIFRIKPRYYDDRNRILKMLLVTRE